MHSTISVQQALNTCSTEGPHDLVPPLTMDCRCFLLVLSFWWRQGGSWFSWASLRLRQTLWSVLSGEFSALPPVTVHCWLKSTLSLRKGLSGRVSCLISSNNRILLCIYAQSMGLRKFLLLS